MRFLKAKRTYFLSPTSVCCFLFLWFLKPSLYAQELSYFVIGEKELESTEIYSILQTPDHRLFIASNEGLYEYKHGQMQKIKGERSQIGSSLFNLIANSKNEVFCANLHGQIFKLQGNILRLYAEIPPDYMKGNISMVFNEFDELYAASKYCMKVFKDSIQLVYNSERYTSGELTKTTDGRIFIATTRFDSLIQIKNNSTFPIAYHRSSTALGEPSNVYLFNNELILSSFLDQLPNEKGRKYSINEQFDYKQFSSHQIWRRLSSSGAELIEQTDGELKVNGQYFDEYFISDIACGVDGTLFFGTFGGGLIVVPKAPTKRYYLNGLVNNIQSISADDSAFIFIFDKKYGILKYEPANKQVKKIQKNTIELLFAVNGKTFGLSDPTSSSEFKPRIFDGALKNVSQISDSTFILSTSIGVAKWGEDTILIDSFWTDQNEVTKVNYLNAIQERSLDAVYNKKENTLYVATIFSLLKFSAEGIDTLHYQNDYINANDLLFRNDTLFIATHDYGVLLFKNGKFIEQLSLHSGLENLYVHSLKIDEHLLFISHKGGVQIYDLAARNWKYLGKAEGVEKMPVKDISVSNGTLWLAGKNFLSSFPYRNYQPITPNYFFSVDSAKVSDHRLQPSQPAILSYKQNQLHVYPNFRGVLYESEAYYQYTIHNFENELHTAPVTTQEITYDFLPPGDYTFSMNVIYRGKTSKSISYSFSIKEVFWKSPWAYLLVGITIAISISLLLHFRNKKNQKRNKDLLEKQLLKTNVIESELKALRSQMNPHFIFNSLNSIQDLILQEDIEASYDSLVLFSELVRNALNYSNQDFITLDQEVEFLNAYLQLEKLRFGAEFAYEVNLEAPKSLKIPSLIIQPFVENAIVHGLFHKVTEKRLTINFCLENTQLTCVVKDNGVGRKAAKAIQDRQGKKHTSFALTAIEKRLQILSAKYPGKASFEFHDNLSGMDSHGTTATIYLPYID